jgi:Ca2+-binding RTX toxin-like protein
MRRLALRRIMLAAAGLVVATVVPLAAPNPASAITFGFAFSHGTETVTGTPGNDSMTITCTTGTLRASGIDSGKACGSIEDVVVRGGDGDDTIDVSAVTHAAFPAAIDTALIGAKGHDRLQSGPLDDLLLGGPDSDVLIPFGGHDTFDGGPGFDNVYDINGNDQTITNTRYRGLGNASLTSIETCSLSSGASNDTLDSTGWTKKTGSPLLSGGDGNDTLLGGPVRESLQGGAGADVIKGGGGNDTLSPDSSAVPSNDSLAGGPGKDTVYATMYNGGSIQDTVITVGGTDTISGIEDVLASDDASFAGPVLVDASGFHGNIDITGSPMADTVIGGFGDDTFQGHAGNDSFSGKQGSDALSVQLTGVGTVNASSGSVSSTTDGTDTIDKVERVFVYGDSTAQSFGSSAFPGKVSIQGGGGNDSVNGNGANTTYETSAMTPVTVTDTGITSSTVDVLLTNVGNVDVGSADGTTAISMDASAFSGKVRLFGSTAGDTLIGSPHADWLVGFGGHDVLKGLGGDDTIWGSPGNDVYRGGPGSDRCDDGAGDDATSCEGNAPPFPT